MADWLILLLLVPAIVMPVVLFVGFVGCVLNREGADFSGGNGGNGGSPDSPAVAVPILDSAVGTSVSSIILKWHLDPNDPDFSAPHTFEIERTRPNSQQADPTFGVPDSPFEDPDLPTSNAAVEVYKYRVRSVRTSDGQQSDYSDSVSSPTFVVAFVGPNFLDAGWSA